MSAPHAYRTYQADDIELAYHLHYDHGMPWADALAALGAGTAARLHQQAHQ